ncbi:MAG: sulfatase [Verrucomicrobiota bacterium]
MSTPNLIWIFGDQHRAQALGYRGDPNVCTPNLDLLAAQGVSLDRAVTNAPICCPARGTLVTGLYAHQAVRGHEVPLDPETPTVARAFKEHGYHTAWFGKWHLDGFKESQGRAAFHIVPKERRGGFDTWIGYENNNSAFDCWIHGHDGDESADLQRLPGYETDALTDHFIQHLEKRAVTGDASSTVQPFFAALSVQPPHDPYVAPGKWMEGKSAGRISFRPNVPGVDRVREQAARELSGYYAAIENLDWNVGRIIEALDCLGLYSNTHILFFSDHGDMHGSHGQFRKTNPYEESIRVPMIIAGVSRFYGLRKGSSRALASIVDIAPTSLGLCGVPVPKEMQGRDLSSLRYPAPSPVDEPESAFIQLVEPTKHGDSTDRPWRGVVTNDGWKYVCLEGQPWLMFNLEEDPCEQVNLAFNTRFRKQRKRLQDRLQQWIEETGDRFELPQI